MIEDTLRYFFLVPVPDLPVISKQGTLIGFLTKNSLQAELAEFTNETKWKEIPISILEKKPSAALLAYLQKGKLVPVLDKTGKKMMDWDKELFFQHLNLEEDLQETEKIKLDFLNVSSASESSAKSKDSEIAWFQELILLNIPDPLFVCDRMGKNLFYNQSFQKEILEKQYRNSLILAEKKLKELSKQFVMEQVSKKGEVEKNPITGNLPNSPFQFLFTPLKKQDSLLGFLYQFQRQDFTSTNSKIPKRTASLPASLEALEKAWIEISLEKNAHNISKTAKDLGIPRTTLQNRMLALRLTQRLTKPSVTQKKPKQTQQSSKSPKAPKRKLSTRQKGVAKRFSKKK